VLPHGIEAAHPRRGDTEKSTTFGILRKILIHKPSSIYQDFVLQAKGSPCLSLAVRSSSGVLLNLQVVLLAFVPLF